MYLRGRSMRKQLQNLKFRKNLSTIKELLEIEEVLGSKLTFELLNEQILISDEIDIDSRYSRTKGYYSLFYNEEYNKIQNKTVLVLGAGALGCYISLSLSMYGVRKLIVADYDIIEPSNLNRQILYTESDVSKEKINVLSEKYTSIIQMFRQYLFLLKFLHQKNQKKLLRNMGVQILSLKAIDTPIDIIKLSINLLYRIRYPTYQEGLMDAILLLIIYISLPSVLALVVGI